MEVSAKLSQFNLYNKFEMTKRMQHEPRTIQSMSYTCDVCFLLTQDFDKQEEKKCGIH